MIINVRVKANSSKNKIVKNDESHWDVWVVKPPIDDQANKLVLSLMAKDLGISKSMVSLRNGSKSKFKTVEIANF